MGVTYELRRTNNRQTELPSFKMWKSCFIETIVQDAEALTGGHTFFRLNVHHQRGRLVLPIKRWPDPSNPARLSLASPNSPSQYSSCLPQHRPGRGRTCDHSRLIPFGGHHAPWTIPLLSLAPGSRPPYDSGGPGWEHITLHLTLCRGHGP